MIDQNTPYPENTSLPVQAGLPTPPVESDVPASPTVVVPADGAGVPKWFYFIFGFTIIVFFLVTTLLVLQLTQKQVSNSVIVPTGIPKVTSTSQLPTPTATAAESAIVKLNATGNSDEVTSIEADLKNTDLEALGRSMETVDTEANSSF